MSGDPQFLPSVSDRAERLVTKLLVSTPALVQRAIAGTPVRSEGQQLHHQMAMALRLLKITGAVTYDTLTVPQARKLLAKESWSFSGDEADVESVTDLALRDGDAEPVAARLYLPKHSPGMADSPPPVVVYFHGGGWVLGNLTTHDGIARFLCHHAQVAVLNVDYRLAPEHRFPAAVDDAVTAVRWARRNGEAHGFDGSRLAVAGDSAGGNLSAVVSQQLRGSVDLPDLQVLFAPVTDLSRRAESYRTYAEGFFLTAAEMDWYQDHYLGPDGDPTDPRVSPLLAGDLTGLPPAYVAVAGFDPLRDEGEAYAHAMRAAGVQVTLRRHTAMVHPFINGTAMSEASRAAVFEAVGALRLGLCV